MRRPAVLILMAAIVAAVQIGLLAWTIAGRASVLRDGREVLLKVQPVDPRDLLRGDYVILGYEITRLKNTLIEERPAGEPDYGPKPIWVVLRKGADNVYHAEGAAFDRNALAGIADGDVVIRGTTRSWPADGSEIDVDYGLERFYLPEGAGRQIEQDMRQRPFFVVAAVAEDGSAQIKAFKDGETTLFEEPYY